MNKREFLRTLGGASLALLFGERAWARYAALPPAALARDEDFWAAIRAKYLLTPDYINLENGYFLLQSQPVLEAFIGRVRDINLQSTRYMRTRMADDNVAVRARLAAMAGVPVEELIVTRNTTESLDTVIGGFRWQAGDEAVMAAQDYGAMLDMFALVALRLLDRRKTVGRSPDCKLEGFLSKSFPPVNQRGTYLRWFSTRALPDQQYPVQGLGHRNGLLPGKAGRELLRPGDLALTNEECNATRGTNQTRGVAECGVKAFDGTQGHDVGGGEWKVFGAAGEYIDVGQY